MVTEDLIRETLEDELQRLQLENIELKSKYKAVKSELQNYQTLNNELESEIANNQTRINELEFENRRLASNEKNLRRKNEARINELNELLNWHKAGSQSRIEQLESEIEKLYQRDLRTEARNNKLLEIENRRRKANLENLKKFANIKLNQYQKDFEKETKLVRQYNRLVKG